VLVPIVNSCPFVGFDGKFNSAIFFTLYSPANCIQTLFEPSCMY
jgi:hypothetical protein